MAASRGHAACKARQQPGKAGSTAAVWIGLAVGRSFDALIELGL
jgi:hypothetical protein